MSQSDPGVSPTLSFPPLLLSLVQRMPSVQIQMIDILGDVYKSAAIFTFFIYLSLYC